MEEFLGKVWELALNAGIFAVPLTVYMWLRAEAKRDQAEADKDAAKDRNGDLLEKTVESNNNLASSIREWNQVRIAQMNDKAMQGR